jgi:hypothetical protein
MKAAISIIAISATLAAATPAAAQDVNLSGRYQCIQVCASDAPGQFAYVTQYGRELNVVNEVGIGSRAWIDYPGRIWIERAEQGAVYSADGMAIQFDRGTVWQRVIELPPPPPPPLRRKY